MAPAASKLRAREGLGALPQLALAQYLRLLRLYPVLTKAVTRSARSGRGGGPRAGGGRELGRPRGRSPGDALSAKGETPRAPQSPALAGELRVGVFVRLVLTGHCQGARPKERTERGCQAPCPGGPLLKVRGSGPQVHVRPARALGTCARSEVRGVQVRASSGTCSPGGVAGVRIPCPAALHLGER